MIVTVGLGVLVTSSSFNSPFLFPNYWVGCDITYTAYQTGDGVANNFTMNPDCDYLIFDNMDAVLAPAGGDADATWENFVNAIPPNISHLSMTKNKLGRNFDGAQMFKLGEKLRHCDTFVFTHNELTDDHVSEFFERVTETQLLSPVGDPHGLYLDHNNITSDGFNKIFQAYSYANWMENNERTGPMSFDTLSISYNRIGIAFQQGHISPNIGDSDLINLNIAYNGLDNLSFSEVVSGLKQRISSEKEPCLEILDVSGNTIGRSGLQEFTHGFQAQYWQGNYQYNKSTTLLKELRMDNILESVGEEGAWADASHFKGLANFEYVDMVSFADNDLRDQDLFYIVDRFVEVGRFPSRFHVQENEISWQGAHYVARAFLRGHRMQMETNYAMLVQCDFVLVDQSFEMRMSLRHDESRKRRSANPASEIQLESVIGASLECPGFLPENTIVVEFNQLTRRFKLSKNALQNGTADAVVKGINPFIVDMSGNSIGSRGASLLGQAISSYAGERRVVANLENNGIDTCGGVAIAEALANKNGSGITQFNLNGNKVQTHFVQNDQIKTENNDNSNKTCADGSVVNTNFTCPTGDWDPCPSTYYDARGTCEKIIETCGDNLNDNSSNVCIKKECVCNLVDSSKYTDTCDCQVGYTGTHCEEQINPQTDYEEEEDSKNQTIMWILIGVGSALIAALGSYGMWRWYTSRSRSLGTVFF